MKTITRLAVFLSVALCNGACGFEREPVQPSVNMKVSTQEYRGEEPAPPNTAAVETESPRCKGSTATSSFALRAASRSARLPSPAAAISLIAPDGKIYANELFMSAGRQLYVPALPASGTYTIYVDPGFTTGDMTLGLALH